MPPRRRVLVTKVVNANYIFDRQGMPIDFIKSTMPTGLTVSLKETLKSLNLSSHKTLNKTMR